MIWEQRQETERLKKLERDAAAAKEQARLAAESEGDRARAAATTEAATEAAAGATRFEYTNGDVYVGEMKDGMKHGQGRLELAEDGAVYEGAFEHDAACGHGTKEWVDGIKYVGEWKDGMMHGQGVYTTAEYDGANVMEGEFEEDCFVG